MRPITDLDKDLALTEISLQAASLEASVRKVVAESASRILSQYPGAGLSERDIEREFERVLLARGLRLEPNDTTSSAEQISVSADDGHGTQPY
jgi:hypothetical protein